MTSLDIIQVKLEDSYLKMMNILILILLIKCHSGSFNTLSWIIDIFFLKYWFFLTILTTVAGLIFYIDLLRILWGMNEWHTKFHNKRYFVTKRGIKSGEIKMLKVGKFMGLQILLLTYEQIMSNNVCFLHELVNWIKERRYWKKAERSTYIQRIMTNKRKSFQNSRIQRCIQNSVKHLRWRALGK